MSRMLFTYGCDTCGVRRERFVLSTKRDEGAPCECGGTFERKRDSTGGLQRGGRWHARNEAREATTAAAEEAASRPVNAAFNMNAKYSTFSGDWRVTGYDTVFAGDYENCTFSADIVHRQEPDPV